MYFLHEESCYKLVQNPENFVEIHDNTARNKYHFHRRVAIACFQKYTFCTSPKIIGSLPCHFSLLKEQMQFKIVLRRYINTHSFNAVRKFLMYKDL